MGRHRFRELGLYDDSYLPGLKRLVDALHPTGARVSIQIAHAGSRARSAVSGGSPIAPSPVPTAVFEVEHEMVAPQEMSAARIEETTSAFVAAARRAQRAGFDVVELHAAHGYLISQFLAPSENRRTDGYGGSLENRARFGLEIVRRIKREVSGLPVIFRIGVDDFFPGGLCAEEGVQVAQWAAAAGADAVSVTAGHYRSLGGAERMIPPMRYAEGLFLDLAARVKAVVEVPVIGVGRLGDPVLAEQALRDGKLDLMAIGRPLFADPQWPAKVRAGVPVRRCLACNHCVNDMRSGAQVSCLVNPGTGREMEFAETAPPRGERIIVVGAGPAGLSYASLVADGNQVTVLDRAARAGGAFRYTGKAPWFNDVQAEESSFAKYVEALERACRGKGVQFHYGAEAGTARQLLLAADRVVIATGARYRFAVGPLVRGLLHSGLMRTWLGRRLFAGHRLRDWFYYRLRAGTGDAVARRLGIDAGKVVIIGDAARAGKAPAAIRGAFEAALHPGLPSAG